MLAILISLTQFLKKAGCESHNTCTTSSSIFLFAERDPKENVRANIELVGKTLKSVVSVLSHKDFFARN